MSGTSAVSAHDWPVVGHRAAVEIFQRAVSSGHVGHAYLISGPEGVGRGTLARVFAQALVCTSEERPCGTCSACRRALRGLHPDVLLLNLETQRQRESGRDSKNTRVSIEAVRELCASLALRPLEASWRIALLEDVDYFSRPAFDALLKTLEEPPSFVVMILIANEAEAIPETIRSRCRPVVLEPLARSEVVSALIERGSQPDLASAIAAFTRGRLGEALALLEEPKKLEQRQKAVEAALAMIGDALEALSSARQLAEMFRRGKRDDVESQLDTLLGLWRDILLAASGCADQVVNADYADPIGRLAQQWTLVQIQSGLRATFEALNDLAINVQPRLALDRMVTQWPRPSRP